jgi:hypothetical protein
MITLQQALEDAILPALPLVGVADTPEARVLMLAIGLQESAFKHRRQVIDGGRPGPATGFWQFERGGGVRGVLRHEASKVKAVKLCAARQVMATEQRVWEKLQTDDILAAGFARLLLLTDPRRLPKMDDTEGAWAYYIRNWRPGKPHPAKWPGLHAQARAYILGRMG